MYTYSHTDLIIGTLFCFATLIPNQRRDVLLLCFPLNNKCFLIPYNITNANVAWSRLFFLISSRTRWNTTCILFMMVVFKGSDEDNVEYSGKEEGDEGENDTCCTSQSNTLEDSITTVVVLLSLLNLAISGRRNRYEAKPALTAVEKSPIDVKNLIVDIQERLVLGLDRNWHRKIVVAAILVRWSTFSMCSCWGDGVEGEEEEGVLVEECCRGLLLFSSW